MYPYFLTEGFQNMKICVLSLHQKKVAVNIDFYKICAIMQVTYKKQNVKMKNALTTSQPTR